MSLRKDTRRQFSKMRSGLLGMSAQVGASAFTLEEKLAAALNRARLAALAINPFHSSETLSATFSYYCRHSEPNKFK